MSTSGLQRVFQIAVAASGVKKQATIHTLRHSYATHLLEEGVSLRYVSAYPGHATLEQTLIYTHLTAASEEETQKAVARMAEALGAKAWPSDNAVFSLADAVRRHWPAYVAKYGNSIPPAHVRAAQAILRCRTEEAGMVYFRCGDCGRTEASPVSCGHRACNACGQHKAMEWEARQKSRLLPVPYHMVTFTLAIHYLVPGGALTDTGWVRPKDPDILVPATPLAVRMRNRFRAALKAADFKLYLTIPASAWKKPWRVDDRSVGRGDTAFGYLARYVQKTALDAARIVSVTGEGVTIRWTDRESGESRTAALSGEEPRPLARGRDRLRGTSSPAGRMRREAAHESIPPAFPPARVAPRVYESAALRLFERRRA